MTGEQVTQQRQVTEDRYCQRNASRLIGSKEFLEFPIRVLLEFCGCMHTMDQGHSDVKLFSACLKWAEFQCQTKKLEGNPAEHRNVLESVLKTFTFSAMSIQDFLGTVVPSGILTHAEIGKAIVDMQKEKEKEGNVVKLKIRDYRREFDDSFSDSEVNIDLTTTIFQLKKMKIFNGGKEDYAPDTFNLNVDKQLIPDCATLQFLHRSAESFVIECDSVTFVITVVGKEETFKFPLAIKPEHLFNREEEIIKGHLFGFYDIHPDCVKKIDLPAKRYPGAEIEVLVW